MTALLIHVIVEQARLVSDRDSGTASAGLNKLAFDFEQRGGSYPGVPAGPVTEFGQFRLNSSLGFTAVPEPSAYAMLALGLALFGARAWARRRRPTERRLS